MGLYAPWGRWRAWGCYMPPGGMPDPSSHYSFWAGMLLKTIFSQGKIEMKMPLGKSRGPLPAADWSNVVALRTTLVSSSRREASGLPFCVSRSGAVRKPAASPLSQPQPTWSMTRAS